MRSSSVLLATLKGISTEVAKNIVLAGIGSLSILDHEVVQERDLGANFFLREEDVGSLVSPLASLDIGDWGFEWY